MLKEEREELMKVITNGLGLACRAPSNISIRDLSRNLKTRTNGRVTTCRKTADNAVSTDKVIQRGCYFCYSVMA
jgi:hypothetical protein